MVLNLDKNREGIAIGFGLGLVLFFLYRTFSFFSPIFSPLAAIVQTEKNLLFVFALGGIIIGYIIDNNLKETKLEKRLRKWV